AATLAAGLTAVGARQPTRASARASARDDARIGAGGRAGEHSVCRAGRAQWRRGRTRASARTSASATGEVRDDADLAGARRTVTCAPADAIAVTTYEPPASAVRSTGGVHVCGAVVMSSHSNVTPGSPARLTVVRAVG